MSNRFPVFLPDGRCRDTFGYYGTGMVEALLYYYSTTASDDAIQYVLSGRCEVRAKEKGIPSIFD